MKRHCLLGATSIRSFAGVGIALALALPAHAQEAPEPDASPQTGASALPATGTSANANAAGDLNTIIVTGTRIRSPNIESSIPIASLAADEFFQGSDDRRRGA